MEGDKMSEICRVYLSGGMSNLTLEEQTKWRDSITNEINYNYDCAKKPVFFNPTSYYSIFKEYHNNEREAMEYDLYKLRNSDLVIVNFNAPRSIGTAMELMLAKEYRIPVIAFGINEQEIHPWLLECCTRVCDNIRDTITHVVDFYLN